MIAVIADDMTGAAEIGGIGLRYGLQVVVTDKADASLDAGMMVVYTNARSLPEAEAVAEMQAATAKLKDLKPSLFYKKIDSVLRGHVLAETKAQMQTLGLDKALVVPVNPGLGRTITGGNYYVNGQPIHHTGFSTDPEFPVRSASVKDMLRSEEVMVIGANEELNTGISVGEAASADDVTGWARRLDGDAVFLAGGASFFDALLANNHSLVAKKAGADLSSPVLLVSGTTYQKSRERRKAFAKVVTIMPPSLSMNAAAGEHTSRWADDVVAILSTHGKAIMVIGEQKSGEAGAGLLRERLSEAVSIVLQKVHVGELFIEGGATAYAVVQRAGFSSFIPTEEWQQGVVRMQVRERPRLHLTIKPGSYDWPAQWSFT